MRIEEQDHTQTPTHTMSAREIILILAAYVGKQSTGLNPTVEQLGRTGLPLETAGPDFTCLLSPPVQSQLMTCQ